MFTNHFPIILILFITLPILLLSIVTNYSNLLYQCFTSHYQSDLMLYITSIPMIINNLPIYHYQP